ncbi:MAG: hypothetical protein KatS3mg109_0926 [Pirellulaceae bacterium]|nr:MAG: hypothetical protein KatS3mg109_0926 [Pirellulaceae bacterium]GIW96331.1 MAG: hypothetical protein KatS3mg110_4372 [Pirellulaceae bacterium]
MNRQTGLVRIAQWLETALASLLIAGVKLYQFTLGPILGGHCRFTPTCSQYFIEAVRKYGPWRGSLKGIGRILRCHPWQPGGYDPP